MCLFVDFKKTAPYFLSYYYYVSVNGGQKYCGNSLPPVHYSTGNRIWIRFETYNPDNKRGFKIKYETGMYRIYLPS